MCFVVTSGIKSPGILLSKVRPSDSQLSCSFKLQQSDLVGSGTGHVTHVSAPYGNIN